MQSDFTDQWPKRVRILEIFSSLVSSSKIVLVPKNKRKKADYEHKKNE